MTDILDGSAYSALRESIINGVCLGHKELEVTNQMCAENYGLGLDLVNLY